MSNPDLFFKQIPAGPMGNFVYLLGSQRTRELFIVDPAWAIDEILKLAAAAAYTVKGALVTHYHPDHVGGSVFGMRIEGLARLLERQPVRIYVNEHEADGLRQITGVSESDMVRTTSGQTLEVGDVGIQFIHTPGHTPGSQCFLVGDRLVSGDTLFIQACGRVDLPGANPEDMYYSLTQKLAKLPDDILLFPGHSYGGESSTMGREKQTNMYLKVPSLEQWLAMMG